MRSERIVDELQQLIHGRRRLIQPLEIVLA
jgi:hypothetical protein